jgi:hypothetical protein
VGYLVVELYSSHTNAAQQEVLKQYFILHYCAFSFTGEGTEEDKGKTGDKET